ncbi:MAG: hypothetical protein ABSC06_07975 [Rhodopila sp.]|jgi:hypothetical protein
MTVDTLRSLLTSPHLIDAILVLTVFEALVVVRWRGLAAVATGLMLLPGVFLLLALRAALAGVPWPWVSAALGAALVAHLLDLRSRWRR